MRRVVFALIGVAAVATARAADPPVTDPKLPSPQAEAGKRWVLATFEAPVHEYFPNSTAGSEAARMLATVRRGDALRSGVGWYDPGKTRYGWSWFAERYDANRDGRISQKELGSDLFAHLDRDRDGAVTADDFDWSDRSEWAKLNGTSMRLFRAIDRDGSGKLSEQEMLDYFKKLAKEKGHVTPDDLRDALLQAAAVEKGKGQAKKESKEGWMKGLFDSDLGSPFDGPRVGQDAPDFTLPLQNGKGKVTLSDYQDKRPVVLIFGSFT